METLSATFPGGVRPCWITETTAILVVHGIGNQLPLETLEQFGKNLVQTYQCLLNDFDFSVEHRIRPKTADSGSREWYDNYLRIRHRESEHYIDLYEYYWAHYTEGKADWEDINNWIQGITSGAKKFYTRNQHLSQTMGDVSFVTGSWWKYNFFISFVGKLVMFLRSLLGLLNSVAARVPLVGSLVSKSFDHFTTSTLTTVANVAADLVAYSVTDSKSKYYPVRRAILDGAVKALNFLIEDGVVDDEGKLKQHAKGEPSPKRHYQKILVAGHSLGSIIAYDTLNKLNVMVNACELASYQNNGCCKVTGGVARLKDQFAGFVTFGSPLDKQAFFLRENIPDSQFVRQQLLNHYNNFKRKDWSPNIGQQSGYFEIANMASPIDLLNDITWRNYFDEHDYISGDLDYYGDLTNVDCAFKGNFFSFTHSDYWSCKAFYQDIIIHFLK